MKSKRKYIVIILTIVFLSCIVGFIIKFTQKEEPVLPQFAQRGEHSLATWLKSYPDAGYRGYLDLEQNDYGVVYISSYKCRNMDLEFLSTIYGKKAVSYTWTRGTSEELQEVLEIVQNETEEAIIYLEIDVLTLQGLDLAVSLGNTKAANIYIYFTPYSVKEWNEFKQNNEAEEIVVLQEAFVTEILGLDQLTFLSFDDQEWMGNNPLYYDSNDVLVGEAVMQVFSTFEQTLYQKVNEILTAENIGEQLVIPTYTENNYVDLKGKTIFYLGDSMYAKDKNESGIAEITSAFLNAKGYNLSIMGSGITGDGTTSLTNMVDILINNNGDNLSGVEVPEVIEKEVQQTYNMIPHYIVLRYGYNDYSSQALEVENSQFASTLYENIKRLQERFPTTQIIVSTPTVSSYSLGYEIPLKDYVDEIIKVSQEIGVPCLNNYDIDIFTEAKVDNYLIDGVHYNVAGRFYQAERLAEFIQELEK